MKVLFTGGTGFIGSAVVRHLVDETKHEVFNLDALTCVGDIESRPCPMFLKHFSLAQSCTWPPKAMSIVPLMKNGCDE